MPLAQVLANDGHESLTHEMLRSFSQSLRDLVAETLTCDDDGGELTAMDIEVRLNYRDPKRDFGGEEYDVQVTIWANDFPGRRANLQDRCSRLNQQVKVYLPSGVRGYVWILLAPAAFAEFGVEGA